MSATAALTLSCLLAAAGVGLLRLSWPNKRRALGTGGWALLAAAAVLSGWAAGAWGVSVTALAGMAAAALLLAVAAAKPPARQKAAEPDREGGAKAPRHVLRRVLTAVLTIIGGFAASLCFGLAVRGLFILLGASEADANAGALFLVPLGWAVLFTWMLMVRQRRVQLLALGLVAVPGLAIVLPGALG